jgi:regulator of cell morphogenesis and NO signaling
MGKLGGTPTAQGDVTADSLALALEREHREIDRGIQAFLVGQADGRAQTEPLTHAIDALRRHIFLEEEFLFPPLREAGLVAPIFVMLREHGEIWDALDVIATEMGAGAARSTVDETCRALLAQLERHNSKEEPIIYSQADAVLTAAASAGLKAFLAAGRFPEGWVCARAGTSS